MDFPSAARKKLSSGRHLTSARLHTVPSSPLPPGLMSARNYFVSRYFLLNPLQGEGIFVTLQLKAHSRWQPWRPLNFCSLKCVTCMDSIAKWGRQLYPRNDTQKPIITSLSHAETEARADFRGFSQRFLFFSGECVVKRERGRLDNPCAR